MKKSTGAPQQPQQSAFKAESYVSANVTLEQVQEIKQAFDLFDTDQGGSIDIKGIDIFKL